MGLLNKIFGNRDDPGTAAGEGADESSPDRETIELEPYEPTSSDEPAAAPEQSGPVTFAPPASAHGAGGRRRKRRRAAEAEPGSEERPHELTRRRIARPTVSTEDAPPIPPPIPVELPEADDPEEIDVSDQLDEVSDAEADLDATSDLIIEDDDDEETSTSVAVWRDPAAGPAPSPPPAARVDPAAAPALEPEAAALDATSFDATSFDAASFDAGPNDAGPQGESGSIAPNTTRPDPERTTMATDTKRPKQTLVEAGTEFRGTLKSSCPVVVNGTLDGEIEAPTLSVASTGSIHGNIRVDTLRSWGTLAGSVDAGEVYVSGAVRSKTVIRARRMELALGSSGKGHVEVTLKSSEVEPSDASSALEASTAPSVAATGDSEASGGAAWDLPEADSSVEPAQARAGKRTAK